MWVTEFSLRLPQRLSRWREDLPDETESGAHPACMAKAASPLKLELRGQWTIERPREHRAAVLVALAGSHRDLVLVEIDVFDAQAKTLADTQPRAVHQCRRQPGLAVELREDGTHFVAGEHDGHPAGYSGANDVAEVADLVVEDVAVQEQQR